MFFAARVGEESGGQSGTDPSGSFMVTERAIGNLRSKGLPEDVLNKLGARPLPHEVIVTLETGNIPEDLLIRLKTEIFGRKIIVDRQFSANGDLTGEQNFSKALNEILGAEQTERYKGEIIRESSLFKVSPLWLIFAYMIVSLAEIMLSPMGLSLVSKIAPARRRAMMMGGWFLATAIGNKLTAIGVFWQIWRQSSFFLILGAMALVIGMVLLFVSRRLRKMMPSPGNAL